MPFGHKETMFTISNGPDLHISWAGKGWYAPVLVGRRESFRLISFHPVCVPATTWTKSGLPRRKHPYNDRWNMPIEEFWSDSAYFGVPVYLETPEQLIRR